MFDCMNFFDNNKNLLDDCKANVSKHFFDAPIFRDKFTDNLTSNIKPIWIKLRKL